MGVLGQLLKRLARGEGAQAMGSELATEDPGEEIARAKRELMAGRRDAAMAIVRGVVARHPARWDGHAALGALLCAAGRADDGVDAYSIALRAAEPIGDPGDTFVELAIALCAAGRTRDGATLLLERLPRAPSLRGHRQLANAALALGWFELGWPQLEFRWFDADLAAARQEHPSPRWDGQDLAGRTILLRAEQGIGDTIQYLRYAPLVRARGARVLLQPFAGLEAFCARFDGLDAVTTDVACQQEVDFVADLMSLPRVFGTVEASIPPPATLRDIDRTIAMRWRARLEALPRPRVGLVWAGRPEHSRDRQRSIPFERLRGVLDVGGVSWVSLQKGAAGDAWRSIPSPARWLAVGPELATLDDTAAVIACLDLVVSVDTSVAHLAGTMGVPTWTLVPMPADSRWLEGREDTPWYRSMRLIRQRRVDDWTSVLERLREDLAAFANSPGIAIPPRAAPAVGAPSASPSAPASPSDLADVAETRIGLLQFDPSQPLVGRSLGYYGESLQAVLEETLAVVAPESTWVEVGAGVGAHAIAMARAIGPAGRLLVGEASPARRRMLANNLHAHGVECAAPLNASHLDDLAFARLDGLKVADAALTVVTVDGAHATLARLTPLLVLACDEADVDALEVRLQALGYRTRRMNTPWFSRDNFHCRVDDVFDGRAALTLLADSRSAWT